MKILKKKFILFQKDFKKMLKPHQKKNNNPDFAMNIQYVICVHTLNNSKAIT